MTPGWSKPRPETTPRPTTWPAGLATGVTVFAWGFVTSGIVLAIGLLLSVVSLIGWMRELSHE